MGIISPTVSNNHQKDALKMEKSALVILVGVLLILYSLTNFGAAVGQFGKAKAVSGTTSMAASFGNLAGDTAGAKKMQREGRSTSSVLYLIAIFILATAVIEIVAAIGLFSGQNWAASLLVVAAICGILIEIQDTAEDGFGIGKLIFFAINAIALFAVFTAKKPELSTQ